MGEEGTVGEERIRSCVEALTEERQLLPTLAAARGAPGSGHSGAQDTRKPLPTGHC